jgi:hypothetical protein
VLVVRCCGAVLLCCGCCAEGCGTARMSRQADEVARASWAELWRASLSLGGRALLCAAINAVTAVELFSKADALPRMLQMWVRAQGPAWKRLQAARLGCGRLQRLGWTLLRKKDWTVQVTSQFIVSGRPKKQSVGLKLLSCS